MKHNKEFFPKEIQEYLDKVTERKWLRRFHNTIWMHTWKNPFKYDDEDYVYLIVHCDCGNMNAKVVQKLPEGYIDSVYEEFLEEDL